MRQLCSNLFFFIFFIDVWCVYNRASVGVFEHTFTLINDAIYPSLSHTAPLYTLLTVVVCLVLHVQSMRLWQVLASVVNISVYRTCFCPITCKKFARCLRFNWMYDFAWASSVSFFRLHTYFKYWRPKTVRIWFERFDLAYAQIPVETLNFKKASAMKRIDTVLRHLRLWPETTNEFFFSPNTFE